MNLELDVGLGEAYTSRSQVARKITESWGTKNLFCLACPSEILITETANTPVRDYACPNCGATYQLKSKNGSFGKVVQNSAYQPKMAAIANGRVPHYAFLQYSRATWSVTDLFVVPGHLISAGVIQMRNPLKKGARREGWVGSNILLGQLPADARVSIILQGIVREPSCVRDDWRRYVFLQSDERGHSGWGADILSCVHKLQRETGNPEFTLRAFYDRFNQEIALWHPDNHHIEAKIRQQLQVLRDGGVLRFLRRGRYRVMS